MSDETSNLEIRDGESYFEWINRNTKIVNKENEQIPFEVLSGKKFIGIYYAANWIPVSKNYLQIIDNAVNAMEAREGCSMGMLLASCDVNNQNMMEFVSTANITFPIIPPDSKFTEALKEKFEIEEIPILVVLDVENNSIVDKVDKLKLESLLDKETPEIMCDTWLGISNHSPEESPSAERKLIGKEKKQQAKAEKERLKKEAAEKKKQDKFEKVEQKKVAKLEKQKSKEIKKRKKSGLQEDTISVNSQIPGDDNGPMSPVSQTTIDREISPVLNATGTEEARVSVPTTPLAYNVVRDGNDDLSDSSGCSTDTPLEKRKKKKRSLVLWGKTDTPKQKDKEQDAQVAALIQKNNELEHQISELKQNKQEQETETKELHEQVDSLNGVIADKDNALKALEYRNSELSSQLLESKRNINNISEEKDILVIELSGLKEDFSVAKEELKNAQNHVEDIELEKQVRETEHQKFVEMTELNGWMHKRGRKSFTRGMWRNRYFQAGEGFKLYYYKSPKMKNLRGTISIGDIIKVEPVENSKGTLLTISTDSSTLELRAPNETTRDSWINSITFLSHYCKKYHASSERISGEKPDSETTIDETATKQKKDGSTTEITKAPETNEISPVHELYSQVCTISELNIEEITLSIPFSQTSLSDHSLSLRDCSLGQGGNVLVQISALKGQILAGEGRVYPTIVFTTATDHSVELEKAPPKTLVVLMCTSSGSKASKEFEGVFDSINADLGMNREIIFMKVDLQTIPMLRGLQGHLKLPCFHFYKNSQPLFSFSTHKKQELFDKIIYLKDKDAETLEAEREKTASRLPTQNDSDDSSSSDSDNDNTSSGAQTGINDPR
ncbi:hypothetical protein LOD99_2642 [Oopsacas minuta]|uniref:protein-disulfide reductase n=1 Tax=Oopsacas minuta TaxID=111878 RepID=A0AAV7K0M5_9METZ|nr:hypothetical protein LOD99_2642 [Oopsacas minuta]